MNFTTMSLMDQVRVFYLLQTNNQFSELEKIKIPARKPLEQAYAKQLEKLGVIQIQNEEAHEYICSFTLEIDPFILYEMQDGTYFIFQADPKELVKCLRDLMAKSALQVLKNFFKERSMEVQYKNPQDLIEFVRLFENISYNQVVWICNRVAVNLSDKVIRKILEKNKAEESALKDVASYYKYARRNKWNIPNNKSYSEPSEELSFFLFYVIGSDYSLLEEIVTLENILKKNDISSTFLSSIGMIECK